MNDIIQTWSPIVFTIVSAVIAVGIYWVRNTAKRETEVACGDLDKRLDEHHDRISKVESKIDDLPKSADIHALALSLERLSGEVRAQSVKLTAVQETSTAMQKSVQRINDYLLNEKAP